MCLVGISYTRELNVKQYKKATKYESKVNRRIAAQLPSFDDIQSNTTYMERLSDLVSTWIRLKKTGIYDLSLVHDRNYEMRNAVSIDMIVIA